MRNMSRSPSGNVRSRWRALPGSSWQEQRASDRVMESRSPIDVLGADRYRRVAGLVLISLLGCGSEGPPPDQEATADAPGGAAAPAAARIEACSLLTAAEVGAAVGEAMGAGTLEEKGTSPGESYFSICTFAPASGTSTTAVTLTVRPSPEITDPEAALEAHVTDMRENAIPDYELEPIEELGPGAGWDPGMRQVTVFRLGLAIIVGVSGQLDDPRSAAVDLAAAALDRAG